MLVKRILLLFFRDKANVFFSLLAVLIIIGLYVLFLGNMMERDLQAQLGSQSDKAGVVMACIILAGMAAVTSVTSGMGAIGICVADKQGAAKDFHTSPVSRGKITFSYIIGTGAVGFIMTGAALALSLAYIAYNGGWIPSAPQDIARLLFAAALSVLCGNALVFFISIFIKSQNAFSALSTVVGTLIGFLMGIYIPVGSLPESVQWAVKCFPMTHAASMFKQVLADGELAALFSHAPPEALDGFRKSFGVVLSYGGFTGGYWFSAAVLAASTAVFYALSLIFMRKKL